MMISAVMCAQKAQPAVSGAGERSPAGLRVGGRPVSTAELRRCEAEASHVSIIRDRWGIPHIYGKTDADAVFGLLYAECEGDFSRVEKNFLEMLGRQAEAYGEAWLYTDVMMRLIYDSAAAVADYRKSPPWMHKLLDAFADGINYYLYKHPAVRPLVLQRFEPWYALMFTDGSVSATSTGGIRPEEIKDFYSKDHPVAAVMQGHAPEPGLISSLDAPVTAEVAAIAGSPVSGDAPETGSNGFAIAATRTASGSPMLYINPHVPFYFRMEAQIVSEEGLNAYGAVTWGQFFIYQGFNAHCGWMHTSSYADVADLYEEKVSEKEGGWVYEYEGQRKPVRSRSYNILYKKGDELHSFSLTGYFTHHGPVMSERNGKWLSLRENNRSLDALLEAWLITKANTFAAYKKAMEIRANTTNNTVYADDQGNIAYWHGNFMPRRDSSYNWALPVDGSVAATEWKGLHGVDETVHVYNPAGGWIQNCNSTPFSVSGSNSPDRKNFPAYMAPDGQNFRSLNAIRLLSQSGHLTLDSLIMIGYDHYLTAFDVLLPSLLGAYHASPDSVQSFLREPVALLGQWDKRCGVHSIATTLAVEWATRMTRYAPRPATPEEATNALAGIGGEIAASTAAQKMEELSAVIADLQRRFGSWKTEWGEICRYQRLTGKIAETYDDHQASLPAGLVSSAFGALPSFQSRVMDGTSKRYGFSGNSFIAAVQFGKRLKARTIVTGGESSDPASKHFSDQAPGYLNGVFKDVLFYKADVLANTEKKYHPGEE